jgi:hypothetical protein
MNLTTVDKITRLGLLENNLPIHYYFEYLTHTCSWLRELNIDTLQIVNTVNLPIGEYGEMDFPMDFVDEVGISIAVNGSLKPIPQRESISPLRLLNSEGSFIPYTNLENRQGLNGFIYNWMWFWNISDYGEGTGRAYGSNGGSSMGYKKVKERRQFQFSQGIVNTSAVLVYISDGQSVDSASQIDIQAINCARAWQDWKSDPMQSSNDYSPKGRSYYNRKSNLRSRLNDMGLIDIREIIHRNYMASPKT